MNIPTPDRRWPADAVERRPVADLNPYENNPRLHSPEQVAAIAASIREFGFTIPILVDEAGVLIAGHGRLLAAKSLGLDTVPVMVARGWTEPQKTAYRIADNQLTLAGAWDRDLLPSELQRLLADGFDLGLLGFRSDDLADLLAARTDGLTDPDDAPPAPAVSVTRPGDVWILGRHRLVCGDATRPDTVAQALAGAIPPLMVTDPPYGVNYDAAWRVRAGLTPAAATGKVANDDRVDWRAAWALFPGHVAYVWHSGLHSAEVLSSLEARRLRMRAQIIWVKQRAVIGRGAYHWAHEPCLYAVEEGADDGWRFVPEHEVLSYAVEDKERADWRGGRKQSTVWNIENLRNDTGHSTQKPVECMRRPMENNSVPGQAVYDPFVGSGTTIIAAEMTGRAAIAIELDPAYVDVCVLRWQAFTGQSAVDEAGRSFDELGEERKAPKE